MSPGEGESVAEPEQHPDLPGLPRGVARRLLENALPLARSQEERRRMLEHLLPEEERRHMLEYLLPEEERRHMLEHLLPEEERRRMPQGLDPMLVEGSMLQSAPVWRLVGSAARQVTSRTAAAFKQQLLHYCTSGEGHTTHTLHTLQLRNLLHTLHTLQLRNLLHRGSI